MRSLQRLGANRIELDRQPFRACTSFFLNALKWIEIAKYLALEHLRKKKGNLCRFHLLKVMNLLIVISQFPRRRPLSLTRCRQSSFRDNSQKKKRPHACALASLPISFLHNLFYNMNSLSYISNSTFFMASKRMESSSS